MTKIPFLFFLLLLCFTSSPSSAVQRHLLHQPFFPVPVTSTAPAQSPHSHHHSHHHKNQPPPPPEKHTFSSVSTPPPSPPHHNPFFPSSDPSSPTSSHSPPSPPPPPASLPTFPANISSLLFPTHTTSPTKQHHTRLITITASVISAASLLSLLAVFLIFLRRSRHHHHRPLDDTKSIRSDSLQLFNGAPSDGSLKHKQPPKYTSSNTSSEFLYLGTLVNSTSTGLDQTQKSPISNTTGVLELPAPPASSSSSSSYSHHHHNKIGSPELRPLPPLPKLPSYSPVFQSSEQLNPKRDHHFDGDDDEFFSPRGSSGRKQSFSDVVVKDSGSNSSSPSNSVSSLNDSPVVKKLSSPPPPLKRACPKRPPPPPPLPPHPLQFSEALAATSRSPPPGDEKKEEKKEESLKPKLKALHWDKVRASSSRVTVWDQIKSNSFQVNEEMIETLFRANDPNSRTREAGNVGFVQSMNQENQFLDPRKSQNIAILLRALNVTAEEVCEALVEGEFLIHL